MAPAGSITFVQSECQGSGDVENRVSLFGGSSGFSVFEQGIHGASALLGSVIYWYTSFFQDIQGGVVGAAKAYCNYWLVLFLGEGGKNLCCLGDGVGGI